MSSNAHSVLIAGAGQLGSRHLQGLAHCRLPLRIYVRDRSADALMRAAVRWSEVKDGTVGHELSLHSIADSLPAKMDVAIVATGADVRPEAVKTIASATSVRFWVLEKVLGQSGGALEALESAVAGSEGAWVNTPRRMMPWHQKIKAQLGLNPPLTLRASGGSWGLACNAVHFLDLFSWWTCEALTAVKTEGLDSHWRESKRPGFAEISGNLEAHFSGGSQALLHSEIGDARTLLEVRDDKMSWQIDEAGGVARRSDGVEIRGKMLYQSGMTGPLVQSILERGSCELPTLGQSVELHRAFLGALLEHWKGAGHPTATSVPIT